MSREYRQLRRGIEGDVFDFRCRDREHLKCSWSMEPGADMLETSTIDGRMDEYVFHWKGDPSEFQLASELDLGEDCNDLEVYRRGDVRHVKCPWGEFTGDNEDLVRTTIEVVERIEG